MFKLILEFTQKNVNKFKQFPTKFKISITFFGVILLVSLIALILPIWPKVNYVLNRPDPNKFEYPISYSNTDIQLTDTEVLKPMPTENRLVIPRIQVDSEILESETLDILDQQEGVWREPFTATPDNIGNMVIAGHRFQYLPPNTSTFYNLDQMQIDDKIMIIWNQKILIYKVHSVYEVTPDRVDIRNNSEFEHELTLYTCTPIYTSLNRLVVKAYLIE